MSEIHGDTGLSAEDMIVEDLERDKSPLRKSGSTSSGAPGVKRGHKAPPGGGGNNKKGGTQQQQQQQHMRDVQQNAIHQFEGAKKKKKKLLWQKGKLIGSGGFGKVFLGLDGNSGTLVAGKEFCFDSGNLDQQLKDLESEMKLMQKLNHKNIVKYYGADKRGSLFYIFMEYVPGGSLRSILDQFGPLQDRVASRFAKQILTGLQYLHGHQVIHRDIKCANVLVNVDGVVKLADFGSAQFFTEAGGTHGTPFWMPPEVIRGESVGWQCDIWSLGCSLIEMLTGETPFKEIGPNMKILYYIAGNDPIIISDKIVQPYVRDFIFQCLQRDPAKRPTVKALLDHDFIQMYSRRLLTGDSQLLNSSSTSYAMQAAHRSVAGSMDQSATSSSRGIADRGGGGGGHRGGGGGAESPQQRDMELESICSLDHLGASSLPLTSPPAPLGVNNPLTSNNGNSNASLTTDGLTRAGLDALGHHNEGDLNVKDLEEEELDDNVKTSLVNRAMSFATMTGGAGGGGSRPGMNRSGNGDYVQTSAAANKKQQDNLFAMISLGGDPTVSMADHSAHSGGTSFLNTVGGSGTIATGSESVLSMMHQVIEVNKNDVIEIELDEDITDRQAGTSGNCCVGVGDVMLDDTSDEEDHHHHHGTTAQHPRGGGGSPRKITRSGDSSEFSGGSRRNRRCTTMQLLQLTVTVLLVGVIGALAALLILKD